MKRIPALMTLLCALTTRAAEPPAIRLWTDGAPGAVGQSDKDQPAVFVHRADAALDRGVAVVVCPGGGYGGLMMSYEGHDIARWLNAQGFSALVLRYRHAPAYADPAPFNDVSRAIRLARSHGSAWGIRDGRVGVMGFSAGGHLAGTAAVHGGPGDPAAADPVDRLSSRPDFQILVYPVISMSPPFGHGGSRRNLLGEKPDPDAVRRLSLETQVQPNDPPAWLVHSVADATVSVENCRAYAKALRAAGVPVDYLELPEGPHGLGCGKGEIWNRWQTECAAWLDRLIPRVGTP